MAFNNYDKNLNPIVKAAASLSAFGNKLFRQGDKNLTPVVPAKPSKPAFNLLKNKVSNADSAKLQKASKLPGRVSDGGPINFE